MCRINWDVIPLVVGIPMFKINIVNSTTLQFKPILLVQWTSPHRNIIFRRTVSTLNSCIKNIKENISKKEFHRIKKLGLLTPTKSERTQQKKKNSHQEG
jgi:hypothetical protein